MHANIRGFTSKQDSCLNIVKSLNPDVVTLNETHMKSKNKVSIQGYFTFGKNRTEKEKGGVATSTRNSLKQNTVKIKEGEKDDEVIITRYDHVTVPINVINCYGEQECRTNKDEITEKWLRLKSDLDKIKLRGEHAILIGDLNKHVGNDSEGVAGNHEKISFGGYLVRSLVASGEYVLINNTKKCLGGPWTWADPANPCNLSCLDLVLVSSSLSPFVKELIIDSERKYGMCRVCLLYTSPSPRD